MRSNPQDTQRLLPVLEIFDHFVAQLQQTFPDLACRKGCSICCSDRVTITQAEAVRILKYLPSEEVPPAVMEKVVPSPCTTNEFALMCLHGRGDEPADFPEKPGVCPLLSEFKECTVYPVRPLMCRLFISRVPCQGTGEARIPDRIFLIQIILQQLLEHLSRGERWGNLATMLRYCRQEGTNAFEDLRLCKVVPSFPITTEEKDRLSPQLNPLFDRLKRRGWLPKTFNLNFEGSGHN